MQSFIDMANRLIQFSPKNTSEYQKGGISSHPKNTPGHQELIDTIEKGMRRPKRGPRDFPMPGRFVS